MKKKECPSCAMKVDEKDEVCPICEYEFPSSGRGRMWFVIFLLIIFLAAAFGGIFRNWFI